MPDAFFWHAAVGIALMQTMLAGNPKVVHELAHEISHEVADELPSVRETGACFHCGLPLPKKTPWWVDINQRKRLMCCPGCQAVAQAIVDNGLSDYYRSRNSFSSTAPADSLVPLELQLYDAPENMKEFAELAEEPSTLEATFSIEDIRCAACVWLIERRVTRIAGVLSATVNVANQTLQVKWKTDSCKPSGILAGLRELGYHAYPFDAVRRSKQLQNERKLLFRQLFVAGLAMMQVMMYAFPSYIASGDAIEADMASLMKWASLLLTVPAVFYSALPFFKGAWANIRNYSLGMDVPVALGIATAFIGSCVALIRGQGDVYFDSVTMFIFLLLCSRYIEMSVRCKAASALEKLHHSLPASACRMTNYPDIRATEIVPAQRLAIGDMILVKPGETIPADALLIEGCTQIDASLLTGESRPMEKKAGASLPGGAVNISQPIMVRVVKPAQESTLSALVKMVEKAEQSKPLLSLWADRVAAMFVAALLLLSLLVFLIWHHLEAARAWPIAIAVLVVSCPCALSLATPAALAAATDRLIRQRILAIKPHVLETLHRCTHIVFDKTGTLTLGKMSLQAMQCFGNESRAQCLRLAAAMEASSAHPLAAAIIEAAQTADLDVESLNATVVPDVTVHTLPGLGLECTVGGRRYRLGSQAFIRDMVGYAIDDSLNESCTSIYLGCEGAWLARFDLRDQLRDDAKKTIDYFKSTGREVILLSGDHDDVVQRIADELGIRHAYGEQKPDKKLAFVQNLQKSGCVVAMVGDGINDAAVLSGADVSFAMGAGSALAQTHADTVLLSDKLSLLCDAANTASRTMKIIRQNLAWAALYNLVAIPAAAFGLLSPWLCGAGMAVSSVLVVLNAMRLRQIKLLPKDQSGPLDQSQHRQRAVHGDPTLARS